MAKQVSHPTRTRPLQERSTVAALMRPAATTIESRAHLAGAAYVMSRRRERTLVVTTDDEFPRPVAVITDADVVRAIADGLDPEHTRIEELWPAVPVTVESGTSVNEAARIMVSHRLQHVPVVDAGQLVGIVDLLDVARVLERDARGKAA